MLETIEKIKKLVNKKGYIYTLSFILVNDFHIILQEAHLVNYRKQVSVNEAALLLGFLIQKEIDFSYPDSQEDFFQMRKETYLLLEELQKEVNRPMLDAIVEKSYEVQSGLRDFEEATQELFGSGLALKEPIFYSGTGAYDVQFLELVEKKYKYDQDWLEKNKSFNFNQLTSFFLKINDLFSKKRKAVNFFSLSKLEELKEKEEIDEGFEEVLLSFQFSSFFEFPDNTEDLNDDEIREYGWRKFYDSILDLNSFSIQEVQEFSDLINNFTLEPGKNQSFNTLGDFNQVNSNPIIKLDNDVFFLPCSFLLYQSAYESPFYWMTDDKEYISIASKNRGVAGEEISYQYLKKIFGDNVYKSVAVRRFQKGKSQKTESVTDIDILCVLGNKAICFQIKSKKLTTLSRQGDDDSLKVDFEKAIQQAYNQGVKSREALIKSGYSLFDEFGEEIILDENINEVYIVGITTENYPSLTHQSRISLKKEEELGAIFFTIFDLELLCHYLPDKYDFLYYIHQRIKYLDILMADEEIVFLGLHLDNKLYVEPNTDFQYIDSSFGQLIDRDFIAYKKDIKSSDDLETNPLGKKWNHKNFSTLIKEIESAGDVPDIIFMLFDLSSDTREFLADSLDSFKRKALNERKNKNFSLPILDKKESLGFSYIVHLDENEDRLLSDMRDLLVARKYRSKADKWVCFGSFVNSNKIIDFVLFEKEDWFFDLHKEAFSDLTLKSSKKIQLKKMGNKKRKRKGGHKHKK